MIVSRGLRHADLVVLSLANHLVFSLLSMETPQMTVPGTDVYISCEMIWSFLYV